MYVAYFYFIFFVCIGRIWAGHNILRFDCARIREAFAEIGKPAPEPKGTIDSLQLLTQKFGRGAGDMKVSISLFLMKLMKKQHLINICISSQSWKIFLSTKKQAKKKKKVLDLILGIIIASKELKNYRVGVAIRTKLVSGKRNFFN